MAAEGEITVYVSDEQIRRIVREEIAVEFSHLVGELTKALAPYRNVGGAVRYEIPMEMTPGPTSVLHVYDVWKEDAEPATLTYPEKAE